MSFNRFHLSVLLIFLMVPLLQISAQTDGLTEYTIGGISITGNRLYDSKTIISYSGLKLGQTITIPSDETRDAISKLWKLGLFSDIKLSVDRKVGSEVFLIIQVEELPRVEQIMIEGNDHFSNEEIMENVDIVSGEVANPQKLKDIEFNITEAYHKDGYPLADVTVEQLLSASNEARVIIKINEGNRLTVRNVKFEGNDRISSDDLYSAMDNTTVKSWWKFWDRARFDKEGFINDLKLIEDFYKTKGFKDAIVLGHELKVTPDGEDVDLIIKIDEGQQYRINSINISGNELYNDSLLLERIDMKKGDIYDIKKLRENIYGNESETDINSLYLDNGYLAFQVEINEEVVGGNKVDINLKVTENNQFRFGLVNFQGNDKTRDKVLRREAYTVPGRYFRKTDVIRTLQQIAALNYFNPEKLTQDIQFASDSTVNITYVVEERSSDQFNASIGYSGSFGITGALGLTFNNFDITRPFSGGAGQILNFNWQFGEGGTFRTFNIGFTEPWLFDTPTLLGVSLFDTRQNFNNLDIRETGAQLSTGRRFTFPDDFFRGDWAIKFQRTDTKEGAGFYEEGIRTQFSLRQTISRSTVFDPVFPTTGTKVSNTTELSGGPFLPGNTEFIKNVFIAEAYTPLFRDTKFVLFSSFNFSFINSISADKYLPPNEVFFMGGNGLTYNTIALRGYDDRGVGPKNANLTPIGGRVALKYEIELRYPLSLDPIPIFVVAFAEAGNIWSDFAKTNPFDLRRSVGFGTRLLLPAVGLIGFDFGYGFDREIVDRKPPSWLFHFQFGRGF